MIYIGIDIAKNKHDCFIADDNGNALCKPFVISNTRAGFDELYTKIRSFSAGIQNIKVGLEATGHYSQNMVGYLLNKDLTTYVINPLYSNLYRKGQSLRKTKTDKVDAKTISKMLIGNKNLKPYTQISYHNEELVRLTRYRSERVKERARLKIAVSRLVDCLFPELETLVSSLHIATIYALLQEFPGATHIAAANLTRLTNLVAMSSRGRFDKNWAMEIRNAARVSIGFESIAMSMELRHTFRLLKEMDSEISEIEAQIKTIMDEIDSPILSIPGIGFRMGAVIIAELGDFSRFANADKVLAFAGLSPSVYQSGKMESNHASMEKRGSKYLRFALFNATRFVCMYDPTFSDFLAKKRNEGKHYFVAISHATKKLVRVIFHLVTTNQRFVAAA